MICKFRSFLQRLLRETSNGAGSSGAEPEGNPPMSRALVFSESSDFPIGEVMVLGVG